MPYFLKMIIPNQKRLLPGLSILLLMFVIVICKASNEKKREVQKYILKSSISIALEPHSKLNLISDFEVVYTFQNEDDTVKEVTKYFEFTKIKEFRTLGMPSQVLLVFPEANIEFSILNGKLIPKNNGAKQSLISDYFHSIGYAYCINASEKHNKFDPSLQKSFLQDREKELNQDLAEIQKLISNGSLDQNKGIYWKLFREMTHASLVFSAIDFSWLNSNRKDIYEHYKDKLMEMSQFSGEVATSTIENLSWYWAKLNQKKSLTWVDFYTQNRNELGNELIGKAFFAYIKNVSNKHKKTEVYKINLQKINSYAKNNDSVLKDFITWNGKSVIPNLKGILLQNKLGNAQDLASILNKTGKKYILIDFWASWCKPCRLQIPYLKKIKQTLQENNFAIIGISTDSDKALWETAMLQEGLNNDFLQFRIIKGKNEVDPLDSFFGLTSIPRYVVVTREGYVLIRKTDFFPSEEKFGDELLSISKSLDQ